MTATNSDATIPRKRSVTGNLAAVGGLLLLLGFVYVLSYPVTLRACIRVVPAYRPVEWLIDNTPLATPMFVWADVWGVRLEVEVSSLIRRSRPEMALDPHFRFSVLERLASWQLAPRGLATASCHTGTGMQLPSRSGRSSAAIALTI